MTYPALLFNCPLFCFAFLYLELLFNFGYDMTFRSKNLGVRVELFLLGNPQLDSSRGSAIYHCDITGLSTCRWLLWWAAHNSLTSLTVDRGGFVDPKNDPPLFRCHAGWWWLKHDLYFSIYLECHHPNWRTHTFQRDWNHQPVLCLDAMFISGWGIGALCSVSAGLFYILSMFQCDCCSLNILQFPEIGIPPNHPFLVGFSKSTIQR